MKRFVVVTTVLSVLFFGAVEAVAESTMLLKATPLPILSEDHGKSIQSIRLEIMHEGDPIQATVRVTGAPTAVAKIEPGKHTVDVVIPAVDSPRDATVDLIVAGKSAGSLPVTLQPVRHWTLYLLPHSHNDIGYTKVQTEVEADQIRFLHESIAAAQRTANNPAGSVYRWNSEVLWGVDGYLRTAKPEERQALIDAVRNGWIGLDALYGNELTGLCRPEELIRLTSLACRLRDELGVPVDTAMISDVPGYTWGLMATLAQSGIKYFSIGPNRGDRIGTVLSAWGDRPFYWTSPSGQEKVLCWVADEGYSWFHGKPGPVGDKVLTYLTKLEKEQFPYDICYLRYNVGGDNGPPDPTICDFAKDWNAKHTWPKVRVALSREMFQDFEQRYAGAIPTFTGDMTPYWEDGAASTAAETGLNRMAAERLVQAETLWTILQPKTFPVDRFRTAWRNAVLYDEHTWGAYNSISEPDAPFVKSQWAIKQKFAVDADAQSASLLNDSLAPVRFITGATEAVLVYNTCSWPRTQVVILPAAIKRAGDRVTTEQDAPVASQRLTNGDLAFRAENVPPFGAKKLLIHAGKARAQGAARVNGTSIANGLLAAKVNPDNGSIASFTSSAVAGEFIKEGEGLNEYLYVPGKDAKAVQRAGKPTLTTVERGPLVAALRIDSDAPGANRLSRELRVVDCENRLEIANVIDKKDIRTKEGVHLAYPFNVPAGVVRMDMAWSVVRPEFDQLPGSCKNSMAVQRWVDVSNQDIGVTLAPVDAPMIEVGGITVETPWMTTIAPSTTILSYVMNNYWHTNYKASQDGPTLFRYALRPHGIYNQTDAQRFGIEQTQPLVAVPVAKKTLAPGPYLIVKPDTVLVTAVKRSEDGKAVIIRLFGASGHPENARIELPIGSQPHLWKSDLTEHEGEPIQGPIPVSAYGIVTVRMATP